MAERIAFWDYDANAGLSCPACGWSGTGAGHEELHAELLDVRCPDCDQMLLIVPYPTAEETRAAAAAGNEAAAAELEDVEKREAFLERAGESALTDPAQLPDLPGDNLTIHWDLERREGDRWTVLRHEETVLWQEIAFYEGYERFVEVVELLKRRYGNRLSEVRPTERSEDWLYGDKLSAPQMVADLNAELRQDVDHPLTSRAKRRPSH
jgi:hypothetical protein